MSCDASQRAWTNACTRDYVQSLPPFIVILATLLFRIPILEALPQLVQNFIRAIKRPFGRFLPLSEAEALLQAGVGGEPSVENASKPQVPLWRTLLLSGLALVECIGWLIIASYRVVSSEGGLGHYTAAPFLTFLSWLPAVIVPVLRPTLTPPYDLFTFYLLHLVCSIFWFGTIWYDRDTLGIAVDALEVVGSTANLVAVLVLLVIVLRMPLNVPSCYVDEQKIGKEVSPEDYTPLWSWVTFEWIYPLIKRGTNDTLNEPDVWELSPTMQAKPVHLKFTATARKTLLRRLWAANSLDLILDFTLTFISVVFNYAGPFFLKRILDAFKNESPEDLPRAYIYAFLAFLATVCKAEADVLHLWYGRRAATRMRSELMASIYAKALVRKDYSGIIQKTDGKQDDSKSSDASTSSSSQAGSSGHFGSQNGKRSRRQARREAKAKDAAANKQTSGADIGKIVNLMSGDANRIAQMISGAYFIYGGPFEIIIASVFLYQLLGLSAFAGFLFLIIGSPLNSFLMKRNIRIQKSLLTARDKRMGVLTELINGVKLVKFYGWENRWIDRVLDTRKVELDWLVKSRINQVLFSMLWTTAPILVSIISFLVYILSGHELTIPVAFTAIALFNMLRAPLNIIPAWIVQMVQTGVALDRIATFLHEEEVTDQVSTIKRQGLVSSSVHPEDQRLGIEHTSFKWNEVEEDKDKDASNASLGKTLPKTNGLSDTESEPVPSDSISVNDSESEQDRRFELRDINVVFPNGELTLVTGPTASGKTALLMALLGEMTVLPGDGKLLLPKYPTHIDENGLTGISYAAQSPWLQHLTIRNNILFGAPYDEERYEAVLECCALKPDLEILEDGDSTEIGSRGISLSGGQKARVALARAVYARTKYVLLDDPLSAVDSHTARFLYERLFQGPLLANRTVVLVTHHVELVLPGAHYLVRMLDGRIDVQGTVEDLRTQGVLEAIALDSSHEESPESKETRPDKTKGREDDEDKKKARQLVKDEAREIGGVKWHIYKTYMKASSYVTWVILCSFIVLYQVLGVVEKLWIKTWGEAYTNQTETASHFFEQSSFSHGEGDFHMYTQHASFSAPFTTAFKTLPASDTVVSMALPSANAHPLFYVAVYAAIGFAAAAIGVTNVVVQYTGALRASKLLFRQLLVAVVRATMRWHDSTPTGRMLNRFSKDIETVDSSLGSSLQAVNSSMASFFAAVVTVVVFSPAFILPAIIIGFIYYRLGIGYLNTGRDLRRMESNSRSPIFAQFSELLEGIVTVRAFSSEQRFLESLYGKVDATSKMWYSFWMTNRWLLLHFDFLGGLAVLFTTLLALSGAIGAGYAGVTITSAMGFTSAVYWTCRFWTQLELDLNSVERVVEYLELPQEPPTIIESTRPPAYWPSSSNDDSLVIVEDLVIRYSPELPPVLHGVSFTLKARERVGLLGRTGSGKSTLAMSILRFTDPSSGSITIDGIDITTIGLHDLRSRLTFVAQDATLFSGTIRENIDPFEDFSDEDCMDALRRVRLLSDSRRTSQRSSRVPSREASRASSPVHDVETLASSSTASPTVTQFDDKQGVIALDTQVSAGGINFSQGQRQLLTMARALLRQSSIIILDEATSSIDFATDAKIQTTIREEFKNSLLLTVAHRLRTVIDYDRLIVLDKGQIVEFDTPMNLIQKEGGVFREMCLQSGTYKELEDSARRAAATRS